MLGRSVVSGYMSLVVIALILRHLFRSTGVHILLGSLHSYFLSDPSPGQTGTKADAADVKPNKKARRAAGKQRLEFSGVSEQIIRATLGAKALASLPFADDINSLVTLTLAAVLNSAFGAVVLLLLGTESDVMTVGLCLVLVFYTSQVLLKVDFSSSGRKSQLTDRLVQAVLLGLGGAASTAALTYAPTIKLATQRRRLYPLLNWHLDKATRGADAIMAAVHARLASRMPDNPALQAPPPAIPTTYLVAAVSVWVGVLAIVLLGPALQYTRQLYNAMNVPPWAAAHASRGWLGVKLLQLGFLLPVALVVSQVPALIGFVGIPAVWRPYMAAALLLAIGVVHFLAIRPLGQTYLDGGLIEWHTLLHDGTEYPTKMSVVKLRLDLLRSLLGRAATQLLALPVVSLSLGLLLLLNCGALQAASGRLAEPRQQFLAKLPPQLVALVNATVTPPALPRPAPYLPSPDVAAAAADVATPPPPGTGGAQALEGLEEELLGLTDDGSTIPVPTAEPPGPSAANADGGKRGAKADKQRPPAPGVPSDVWVFLGGYLGWWAALLWSLYGGCNLAVLRLGLNSG